MSVPTYALTQDERLALARQLRGSSVVETVIRDDMEAEMAAVTVTELEVPTRVGPARVLKVEPTGIEGQRPLYINIHGGGFVRPYHRRDTVFCGQLAGRLGCTVLDIDYRLAPEHPFPTALHECHDITAWAFENAADLSVDPDRIVLGGHSAGGNLTAAIALMANASGAFRLAGQILDYPFLDGVTPPEDKLEPSSIFPPERLHAFNVLYSGVPEVIADPLFSPVMAVPEALRGLPPALVLIAGLDPLRFEAQRYAGQLIAAGVDVDVRTFADCDHGFVVAGQGRFDEARWLIADWLRTAFK